MACWGGRPTDTMAQRRTTAHTTLHTTLHKNTPSCGRDALGTARRWCRPRTVRATPFGTTSTAVRPRVWQVRALRGRVCSMRVQCGSVLTFLCCRVACVACVVAPTIGRPLALSIRAHAQLHAAPDSLTGLFTQQAVCTARVAIDPTSACATTATLGPRARSMPSCTPWASGW